MKYINRYLIKHDGKASPWNKISILTEKNKRLTLYITEYLIAKTKTDVRQKNSHVFTKCNMY